MAPLLDALKMVSTNAAEYTSSSSWTHHHHYGHQNSQVWVVSRRYGQDAAMSDVLVRCAHDVAARTQGAMHPQTVMHDPEAAYKSLADLRRLLHGWQTHYMRVRGELETTDGCARWEFGRAALFDRTTHARDVTDGLMAMLMHAAGLQRRLQLPMLQQHGAQAGPATPAVEML